MRDKSDYDPVPLQQLLQKLLEETGESYRQASQASGLHHTVISKYMSGTRPGRDACIALADHFGMNPNEMLQVAGYEPLEFFDRRLEDPEAMSPEVEAFVAELMEIEDDDIRQEMVEALRQVLKVNMRMQERASKRVDHLRERRGRKVSDAKASP